MKKNLITILCFLLTANAAFSYEVKLKITNVKPNTGKITVAISASEESFKNHTSDEIIKLESQDTSVETVIELSEGEYAFSVFQDCNNDESLNTNFLGIPKEPFGFSNYNGKSVPGNFKKHKVIIKENSEITICLYEF